MVDLISPSAAATVSAAPAKGAVSNATNATSSSTVIGIPRDHLRPSTMSSSNTLNTSKTYNTLGQVNTSSGIRKPFPFGFRKARAYMQLKSKQIVVIGDSLHTDVIGAWIAGHKCIQVTSLPHPARWWEKLLGRWLHTPYPYKDELWRFDASEYK